MQFFAHPAVAAEWSMASSVSLGATYNDNIQLTTAPHPTVWGAFLSPDVKFTGATETLAVTGGLNLSFNEYSQSQLNAVNYALILRSTYKASERDLLKLDIDSTRDPTLVSELATTGQVLAYRQRNRFSIAPSWSRALTESTSIVASYGYTTVDYSDNANAGLVDYRNQLAYVSLQSNLTERHSVSLTAYYDLYKTDPTSYKAETYGVRAGYAYSFSETIRGSLSVGLRDTQSTLTSQTLICDGFIVLGSCLGTISALTSTIKDNTAGWTLDASIEKRTETDTLSAQLSRQILPSGQGTLLQTDRLALFWARQWTPTLNASLLAAAYQTQNIGTVGGKNDSHYYKIEPRLSWRLDESWTVDATFRHARQKYYNASVAATGNSVYATIRYVWPRLGVSQ